MSVAITHLIGLIMNEKKHALKYCPSDDRTEDLTRHAERSTIEESKDTSLLPDSTRRGYEPPIPLFGTDLHLGFDDVERVSGHRSNGPCRCGGETVYGSWIYVES